MAGQSAWNDPGSATNAYVVNPQLAKDIYYESEFPTLFGRVNQGREVKVVTIAHGDEKIKIDAGNDSPIWEKSAIENAECRFTQRERMTGNATYGDADVKTGRFAQYKHSVCYVRQVDSPAQPIVGFESSENIKQVINDLVSAEKADIALWRQQEIELDAFRGIFLGASRGLLHTEDGARGVALTGAAAGQYRSCYNTYVEGQSSLTTPNVTRATHEGTLSTLLAALSDAAAYAFDFDSHKRASYLIQQLKFKPVRIGGRQYRALAVIDPRNVERMAAVGGTLAGLFQYAWERGSKNPALYGMKALELDDILYIPSMYMEYFRPTADGTTVTYGCDLNTDPRDGYTNASNITQTVYMGAGALLRGRRKNVWVTDAENRHGKGREYSMHYHDGWMRNEWFTKDGRSSISNDSMLICYNYDPGVGKAYAG
jgi:hypothetical protein